MCLSSINKELQRNGRESTAYKVYRRDRNKETFYSIHRKLDGTVADGNGGSKIPLNQWLTASKGVEPIRTSDWNSISLTLKPASRYKAGFHVYTNLEDAKEVARSGRMVHPNDRFSVVQVRVRDIRTRGFEGGVKVAVAQRMFVPTDGRIRTR